MKTDNHVNDMSAVPIILLVLALLCILSGAFLLVVLAFLGNGLSWFKPNGVWDTFALVAIIVGFAFMFASHIIMRFIENRDSYPLGRVKHIRITELNPSLYSNSRESFPVYTVSRDSFMNGKSAKARYKTVHKRKR